MNNINRIRAKQGLLQIASAEDKMRAIEPDGSPTDLLRVTASKMFNVPYSEVTDRMRRAAKTAFYFYACG